MQDTCIPLLPFRSSSSCDALHHRIDDWPPFQISNWQEFIGYCFDSTSSPSHRYNGHAVDIRHPPSGNAAKTKTKKKRKKILLIQSNEFNSPAIRFQLDGNTHNDDEGNSQQSFDLIQINRSKAIQCRNISISTHEEQPQQPQQPQQQQQQHQQQRQQKKIDENISNWRRAG